MPRLCENGCAKTVVGRVIIIRGPAMVTHYLCSVCRKVLLNAKKNSDSGTHKLATDDSKLDKNAG